jgi:uncharacterized protein YsxB (DUF464 family)
MISVTVERGPLGKVNAFTVENHGTGLVCAAVSILTLNTVNSIEALTRQAFTCEYDENGGFLQFKAGAALSRSAGLLLESMMLGLHSIQAQYPGEIEISERDT